VSELTLLKPRLGQFDKLAGNACSRTSPEMGMAGSAAVTSHEPDRHCFVAKPHVAWSGVLSVVSASDVA